MTDEYGTFRERILALAPSLSTRRKSNDSFFKYRVSPFIGILLLISVSFVTVHRSFFKAKKSLFASTTDNFNIAISSDYDNTGAREIFPWSIVEPYRLATFQIFKDNSAIVLNLDWIIVDDYTGDVVYNYTGSEFQYMFKEPSKTYTVQASYDTLSIDLSIACRYVRRELRNLGSNDLERYLGALQVIFNTSLEDGMRTYGPEFSNIREITKLHSSNVADAGGCTPFHFNMDFYNGHAAIILRMERVMQLIDPTTAMHYWNFIIDAELYGADWANESIIFHDSWFGSSDPGMENGYVVSKGRWAFTERSRVGPNFTAAHNAYGLMVGEWNQNPSRYLQRSQSICGRANYGNVALPTCAALDDMVETFKDDGYTSLSEVVDTISGALHGWCHMYLGGAWNCLAPFDVAETLEIHPDWHAWIEIALKNLWELWLNAMLSGVVECPLDCSEDTLFRDCKCTTKNFNLDDMTIVIAKEIVDKTKAWDVLSSEMETEDVISVQNTDEAVIWLARLIANVGQLGDFAAPYASTGDPLFWPLHTFLIKIADTARVNPSFQPMNMSWDPEYKGTLYPEDFVCDGTHESDKSHVTSGQMNIGVDIHGPDFRFTNRELIGLLHLTDGAVPYVYSIWEQGVCNSSVSSISLD